MTMSAFHVNRRNFLKVALATAASPFISFPAMSLDAGDARTAWFREAKFGMFIHWGPYSLASVEASWPIMKPEARWSISEPEYTALPTRFNPAHFDPDAWIDLARTAGQRYMVFTTKHHDGFCMFDSAYTDYKITKTPYGKDLVRQLADACVRRDMRLGFYYSPPDMHNPNFCDTSRPVSSNWNGEPQRAEWPLYLEYMQLQLTELLTRYGQVEVIWFDGLYQQQKYDGRRFIELIHKLQPGTLVNDRIGVPGDYVTPEQFIPAAIPTKDVHMKMWDASVQKDFHRTVPTQAQFQLWETCMTINETWAYNAHDHEYKSSQSLIRSLVEVVSRGGNFLLNVGPQPDGRIQPEFEARLRALGAWMAVHGESIYGTTFGPLQGVDGIRTTAKENEIFVHVFDWPAAELNLAGVQAKVESARLLGNGEPLKFQQTEGQLKIGLPSTAPSSDVSVVALRTL